MRFDESFKEMIDNAKTISRKSWSVGCLLYNKQSKEIEYYDGHCIQRRNPAHKDIAASDWELI